ncbi:MAG: hypothetical protein R3C61_04705 [Bacteroidia bacterium]
MGVHLAIAVSGTISNGPLTDCPSITDEDGYFYPMVFPNATYQTKGVMDNEWKIEDIENFAPRLKRLSATCLKSSHVSAHMGCTRLSEEVKALEKGWRTNTK